MHQRANHGKYYGVSSCAAKKKSVRATALDGLILTQTWFSAEIDEYPGTVMLPPMKVPSNCGVVIITDNEETTSVNIDGTSTVFKHIKGEYVKWEKVVPDTRQHEYTINIDPKQLKRACESAIAYGSEVMQLNFGSPVSPLYVVGEMHRGVVLPVKMHG